VPGSGKAPISACPARLVVSALRAQFSTGNLIVHCNIGSRTGRAKGEGVALPARFRGQLSLTPLARSSGSNLDPGRVLGSRAIGQEQNTIDQFSALGQIYVLMTRMGCILRADLSEPEPSIRPDFLMDRSAVAPGLICPVSGAVEEMLRL
jgi:hypothetical protein